MFSNQNIATLCLICQVATYINEPEEKARILGLTTNVNNSLIFMKPLRRPGGDVKITNGGTVAWLRTKLRL